MKALAWPGRMGWMGFLAAGLVVLAAGCSTTRVDWTARVGNYTYDQAVRELGPPEHSAKLEDGTVVAEWLTQRGYSQAYYTGGYGGGYYYPRYGGTFVSVSPSPDYFIRLTFGPDGKLTEWKKVVK